MLDFWHKGSDIQTFDDFFVVILYKHLNKKHSNDGTLMNRYNTTDRVKKELHKLPPYTPNYFIVIVIKGYTHRVFSCWLIVTSNTSYNIDLTTQPYQMIYFGENHTL